MKILIINDNLLSGGAETYTLNLKKIIENTKEYEVTLMTFDNEFEKNLIKIEDKKNIINMVNGSIIGKINKVIFNPLLYYKIRKKIKKIKPDKIILNNIFYSPITQMKALNGYEVYQIIHDYSIVCPKSTCIKQNFEICNGYKNCNCIKECKYHSSKISIIFKLYITKRMEKIRKKIVKKLISPSECLNKYLKKYNYDSECINNPIITKDSNTEYKKDINRYIYVGALNENKGIFRFLDVFKKFSENKDVYIEIYGKPTETKYELLIKKYNNNKMKFMGQISNSHIIEKISKSNYMIVPSLWMENYPTTVLEGMMAHTVIIGSNRGGVGELLSDNKGITFDILNDKDILEKLEKSYELSEIEYKKITQKAFDFVSNNNSFERYSKKIIETIGGKSENINN